MTKEEVSAVLIEAGVLRSQRITPEMVSAWFNYFGHFPLMAFRAAFMTVVKTSAYWPRADEVEREIERLTLPKSLTITTQEAVSQPWLDDPLVADAKAFADRVCPPLVAQYDSPEDFARAVRYHHQRWEKEFSSRFESRKGLALLQIKQGVPGDKAVEFALDVGLKASSTSELKEVVGLAIKGIVDGK